MFIVVLAADIIRTIDFVGLTGLKENAEKR
jgi:hypothetical protein